LAGSVNEQDLVLFTHWSSAGSSVWTGSLVLRAVLTGSVLKKLLSQCASVWLALLAVFSCSGVGWALLESSILEELAGSVTACWDGTLSLIGVSSLVRSAELAGSLRGEDLVSFALVWETLGVLLLLLVTTSSGVVWALFAATVAEQPFTSSTNIWSTDSTSRHWLGPLWAAFTSSISEDNLVIVTVNFFADLATRVGCTWVWSLVSWA